MMFFHNTRHEPGKPVTKHRIVDSVLVTTGYILSPLSWWNDLIVNVPLAYAFSFPFSLMNQRLFLPSFILGYWLTNFLGFILLHRGIRGLVARQRRTMRLRSSITIALVYTFVLLVFVWMGWITSPDLLLQAIK